MRDRDLGETDAPRELSHLGLVLRVAVAVHEHDGDRPVAFVVRLLEVDKRPLFVQGKNDVAMRPDALVDLDHLRIEHLRQHDVPVEDARPVLVGDAQRVAEAARDEEDGAGALALEERVGRHGSAHLDRFNLPPGNGLPGRNMKQFADPRERGVAVAPGVFGQQLVRDQAAVGAARDDVGEGAAAVDPELPAAHG